jgi:predicted membrane-bound spermidine synthase
MKLSVKTASTLLTLAFLGAIVGGLAWEVVERICLRFGLVLGVSVGPIGFDLSVVSLHFLVNPGTIAGLLGGVVLFFIL